MVNIHQMSSTLSSIPQVVGPLIIGVASLTGVMVVWFYTRRRASDELLWSMHTYFNGREMTAARRSGEKLLIKSPRERTLDSIYRDNPDLYDSLAMIVQFYRSLWLAIARNRINSRLVPQYFGLQATWWWVLLIEAERLPAHWEGAAEIALLRKFIQKRVEASQLREWEEVSRRYIAAEDVIRENSG